MNYTQKKNLFQVIKPTSKQQLTQSLADNYLPFKTHYNFIQNTTIRDSDGSLGGVEITYQYKVLPWACMAFKLIQNDEGATIVDTIRCSNKVDVMKLPKECFKTKGWVFVCNTDDEYAGQETIKEVVLKEDTPLHIKEL